MRLCTRCGTRNPGTAGFCMGCGGNLSRQPPPVICPSCGASSVPGSKFCEGCGKRLAPEEPPPAFGDVSSGVQTRRSEERLSWSDEIADDQEALSARGIRRGKPFWAGLILIIAGITEIGNGIASFYREIPNDIGIDVSKYVACCATLVIIFGTAAILGGLVSVYRKNFYLALIASILGILGAGWMFTGSIMSLIAMILIALSRDDFES
jgi:ribosomal protein L40E